MYIIEPEKFPPRSSLTGDELPSASSLAESAKFAAARKKAAAIIINGLGDKPPRVVVSHRRDPALMIFELNEQYETVVDVINTGCKARRHRWDCGDECGSWPAER